MKKWKVKKYLESGWEYFRNILGCEPLEGKQIVKYNPTMGGGAHCGNPVMIGQGWWKLNDIDMWSLGIWHYEIAHNFHNIQPITFYSNNEPMSGYFHHFTEFLGRAYFNSVKFTPLKFGIGNQQKNNLLKFYDRICNINAENSKPYFEHLKNGGNCANFKGDFYAVKSSWLACEIQAMRNVGHLAFINEKKMHGDWGLGIGDWGLGIGPN